MPRRFLPDVRYLLRLSAHGLRDRLRAVPGRVRRMPRALRDPSVQTDLLQVVKAVVAAVAAWVLATQVLDLPQAFLAPWSALLTVHATVYRTIARGAQAVGATVLGVLLAWACVQLIGLSVTTLAIALLAGMLLARVGVLRDEGVTVATTALFVLTTGYVDAGDPLLLQRIADVSVGIGCGIAVNLLVVPPLNDRSAANYVSSLDRRMGHLLRDMATEMRREWGEERSGDWIRRTRSMDRELDHAWQVVRTAQEGSRYNPRRRWSRRAGDPEGYAQVLYRLEEGIAEVRSIARTVHESTLSAQEWDPQFRDGWLDVLGEAGRRIAQPQPEVAPLRDDLDALTRRLSREDLPRAHWPVYGALITDLRSVLDVVDDVASAQPVRT